CKPQPWLREWIAAVNWPYYRLPVLCKKRTTPSATTELSVATKESSGNNLTAAARACVPARFPAPLACPQRDDKTLCRMDIAARPRRRGMLHGMRHQGSRVRIAAHEFCRGTE